MNILKQHWEKILLAAVVLAFVLAIAVSLTSSDESLSFTRKKETSDIQGADSLVTYETVVEMVKSTPKSNIEPNPFVHKGLQRCTNCKKLQPLYSKICPECNATVTYKEDADNDGINNKWEQKYGLEWTDPADASLDPDKDGFTNLQEFKLGSNPNDPSDPNIVADEYVLNKVYRPARPIMLMRCTQLKSGVNLQLKYKGRTLFKKEGQKVEDGKTPVYDIGKAQIKKVGVWNKMLNSTQYVDKSELTMTDIKDGKQFTLTLGETNYQDYAEANLSSKADNKVTVARKGDDIDLAKVKLKAKVEEINVKVNSVTFDVQNRKYILKAK